MQLAANFISNFRKPVKMREINKSTNKTGALDHEL